ncbi:hypothetical protein [Pseudoxanthomonas wuyuanensis]|uniref:DUF4239 domain-containing protein n=2 Tax=Pseudoxanthomonas wuyuanensis TaxID=1073196 RepID=A0A286CVY0_9GAMM|nr:hypothetical protein [Pseudoxanthomonas wuyuanensis]KAF1721251.1 hypothetical protein CSC75_07490 [Pseudoxanthomonas wuyuanensis]SOD50561.1 hypothetical protein SAMN06296416_101183 [Pseudoxanthomonas wuyuanensis]
MSDYLLGSMPIAAVYLCVALLILSACETGFRIGSRHHRTHQDKEAPGSVGPIVGGLLGMLGFVLAFTFSMAANQHDLRKQNVLNEATKIATAYLRMDLIAPEHGSKAKHLLREYVSVRLQAAQKRTDWQSALNRSLEIDDQLWAEVAAAAVAHPTSSTSLAVQGVNEVIDIHERRVVGARYNRIPGSVWVGLMAITLLTMLTIGMQIGLTGKRRLLAITPLSLAFAMLVTLIVDLNRPDGGFITVSQQPMIDLQTMMDRSPE